MDTLSLHSGQDYDPQLLRLIDDADVFQLFWSKYAAKSSAVTHEWRYALSHSKGAGFIRPLYWDEPVYPIPPQLANLHFARLVAKRRRKGWIRWFEGS